MSKIPELVKQTSGMSQSSASSRMSLVSWDVRDYVNQYKHEGILMRKTEQGKFKKYFYALMGPELYQYKSASDESHKMMNSLHNVFLRDQDSE